MSAILIEYQNLVHFKILDRRRLRYGNIHQFSIFFEFSNAYYNMGKDNSPYNNYSVNAMDYIYDT